MTATKRRADNARLAAARILQAVLEEGAYANLRSIRMLEQTSLDALDRRFASALIYGTISRVFSIDWLLAKVSHKPLASLDPWIRTILRMGVWQIVWARSVPDSAAIDESVRLAKDLTNPGAAGFVNATLRRLAVEPHELPAGSAVFYSLPPEIFGYLKKWYGADDAELLGEAFLAETTSVTARVNTLHTTPKKLTEEVLAAGGSAEPGRFCPEALRLDLGGHPVRGLLPWLNGELSIQDEAAMLVGHAASPQPGQTIIDLCAAPGGKTCHLAELTVDRARILAFDSHPERLKLVAENAVRLGLTGIECLVGDATGTGMDAALAASADLVLADVPCSGLGLMARKPEIRLNMTHEKMIGLYPLQAAILDYAATLVRPGGTLVYSTCTINPAENIDRIQAFLTAQAGCFMADDLTTYLPPALLRHPDLAASALDGWIQLLPHRHDLDGFFIARLRRT